MNSVNPFVFIVGCPRSGTTLLQRMLNSHPLLAVSNDTHFIPRVLSEQDTEDPALTPELVERVRQYHRFYRLGLSEKEVYEASGSSRYSGFVANLYSTLASKRGKPFAGEKTPDYGRHIPLLHGLFPASRFVHIIRDGRDVALSTMKWAEKGKGPAKWRLWNEDRMATCAFWWRWQIEPARRDGFALGEKAYLEVSYEKLASDPEPVLRLISEFLDLPWAAEMLSYNRGKRREGSALSAKSAWLSPTPGLRDWRRDMSVQDASLFDALAGETLADAGYTLWRGGSSEKIDDPASSANPREQICLDWWKRAERGDKRKTPVCTCAQNTEAAI